MAYCVAENNSESHADDMVDDSVNITDNLSIVPLEKDSFAICELCGRIGLRKHFYPRNNKFCSLRCNASSAARRKNCNWRFRLMEGAEHMAGLIPLEPFPQLQWQASYNDLQAGPIKQSPSVLANSYEWNDELFGCDFLAAPVCLFKHAPLSDMWENAFDGMKVEVRNTDCGDTNEKQNDFFWVATVIKVKGYMGLLRYEGFFSDESKDFWVNLCCSEVHHVGWCATRGKPLIPPRTIENKYTDWKKFLVKQLTGAKTLPANFYNKLHDSLKSRFSVGSLMEVVDKNRISQVKLASVIEIIGKRLHVKYYDSAPDDNGFWCHEDSPLIHHVGWAFLVGHPLDAPHSYCQRIASGRSLPNDTTPDMFQRYPNEPPLFAEGMKLEAIDPLNLSSICAATVMKILNKGYMMIRIDCYPSDATGCDWFCYHQRSPCIFPIEFAVSNGIPLVPPIGFSSADNFRWSEYLSSNGYVAAPHNAFAARGHVMSHGFVKGMRLECADLMDPRLVCVATITRVVADLLKVHFDGWGEEYDQWVCARSPDVYPVGWCRAVGHRLEGPQPPPKAPKRPPPKTARRRKRPNAGKTVQAPIAEESTNTQNNAITKSVSPVMDLNNQHTNNEKAANVDSPSETSQTIIMQDICEDDSRKIKRLKTSENMDPPLEETAPEATIEKVIPRLVNTTVPLEVFNSVDPENWTCEDVAKFLTVNDCQPYCINLAHITGPMLLQLSKDEIIELLEMKVGPSLKIFDLVQQLKCKIKQPQSRISALNRQL